MHADGLAFLVPLATHSCDLYPSHPRPCCLASVHFWCHGAFLYQPGQVHELSETPLEPQTPKPQTPNSKLNRSSGPRFSSPEKSSPEKSSPEKSSPEKSSPVHLSRILLKFAAHARLPQAPQRRASAFRTPPPPLPLICNI
jgi:hypothetical protein